MRENSDAPLLECPGCGASSFMAGPDGRPICDYCHAVYIPPERVCSECGTPYEPNALRCASCGADLVHECLACRTLNPSTASHCLVCGREMGILESLFDRVTTTRGDWLRQVQEEAPTLKAQQEAASEAHLAEMWAAERHRREVLTKARVERDRQQRLIITVTGIIVAVVVVAILVAVVISLTRTPSPYPF